MRALDIMSLPTITVAPGTPVVDIAKRLLENGISAVPVVEPDGTVVGVVSETDLMHRPEVGTDKARVSWLHTLIGGTETPRDYTKTRGLKARDVMSAELYTASPDADLIDVVDIMDRLDVRRVLIMEEQRLVGIVTRSDILKGLLAGRSAAAKQAGDRAIRAMLIDELQRHPWVSLPHDNIEVAVPPRPGGKLGQIVERLGAGTGATADELAESTGWQKHSVLGALSRLRSRGFAVRLDEVDGRKAYRLEQKGG